MHEIEHQFFSEVFESLGDHLYDPRRFIRFVFSGFSSFTQSFGNRSLVYSYGDLDLDYDLSDDDESGL
ncbi:hypothetical protein SG0102_28230 [Intestinibaculum porci]|uniref:Uncharacterized protein n=1 Tax=Intestinibaculum porci TaxID=2487118 RepID=A0A3G9JY20_9FIRM|nr:hypothetical protein SG0102_28230 [Intestinibaculum porci]